MIKKLAAIAIMASLTCIGYAQETEELNDRQRRITEHQERIQQIIGDAKKTVDEAKKRRELREIKEGVVSIQSTLNTSTATLANDSGIIDDAYLEIRKANWQKHKDFYYLPKSEIMEFSGAEQTYSDDSINLEWSFRKKSVSYKWKNKISDEVTTIPLIGRDIILRNKENCLIMEPYGSEGMRVITFIQPLNFNVIGYRTVFTPGRGYTSDQIAGHALVICPDEPTTINGWEFNIDRNTSTISARKADNEPVTIGTKTNDFRPLEGNQFTVEIKQIDKATSAAIINVGRNTTFSSGVFAGLSTSDFNSAVQVEGTELSLADGLSALGKHYHFTVEWEDTVSNELAMNELFPKGNVQTDKTTVHQELESRVFGNYPFTIVDNSHILIRASKEYTGKKIERPKLTKLVKENFPTFSKLYMLKNLSASIAQELIKAELKQFAFLSNSSSVATSDTLLYRENNYSVHALKADTPRDGNPVLVGEKLLVDPDGKSLVVTATKNTHEQIDKILADVESSSSSTVRDFTPPLKTRRLQLVLLQGGEAGTSAPLTSSNYDPALPAKYGMTPEDIKLMGFNGAVELGSSIINIVGSPDETGKATVTLGNHFPVEISYKDERSPYLILNARILNGKATEPLAENTVMVDNEKPTFLGVTNLSSALILVITRIDKSSDQ